MHHAPLSVVGEGIGKVVVASAFTVHKALGPGLLEQVYEVCFRHELSKRGLSFRWQLAVPIVNDGLTFTDGLRLDLLIEDRVMCELKAVDSMPDGYQAQILAYPKLTGKRLGYLINFNGPLIKNGIQRVILQTSCPWVFGPLG